MLRGVDVPDLSTTVLGQPVSSPVLVAPTAYHRLVHPDGELATAVGAARAGTVMVLSTTASTSMEDVAAAAPDGARWFQLYVHTDRDLTLSLLHRAEAAGYRALVLTVDTPRLGRRRRDGVAGFSLPDGIRPANLLADASANLAQYAAQSFDATLTFEAIAWLCEQTTLAGRRQGRPARRRRPGLHRRRRIGGPGLQPRRSSIGWRGRYRRRAGRGGRRGRRSERGLRRRRNPARHRRPAGIGPRRPRGVRRPLGRVGPGPRRRRRACSTSSPRSPPRPRTRSHSPGSTPAPRPDPTSSSRADLGRQARLKVGSHDPAIGRPPGELVSAG